MKTWELPHCRHRCNNSSVSEMCCFSGFKLHRVKSCAIVKFWKALSAINCWIKYRCCWRNRPYARGEDKILLIPTVLFMDLTLIRYSFGQAQNIQKSSELFWWFWCSFKAQHRMTFYFCLITYASRSLLDLLSTFHLWLLCKFHITLR